MKLKAQQRRLLNNKIAESVKGMKQSIPLSDWQTILATEGIHIEEFILCGREGRENIELYHDGESVDNSWLCITWYKHDTGSYDITAYLS